ncbi:hypothetical protein PanWU01x14_290210 [Parasponia andersonii]|uniref:Uncharacterized protein n=1 Tax=Parasponia andersonii TaxID=3476 RepID=A0A2P5AXR3_PARAD|nr:hypothetical protein PanWU01x14_290210 [Parasponia andersonii]
MEFDLTGGHLKSMWEVVASTPPRELRAASRAVRMGRFHSSASDEECRWAREAGRSLVWWCGLSAGASAVWEISGASRRKIR